MMRAAALRVGRESLPLRGIALGGLAILLGIIALLALTQGAVPLSGRQVLAVFMGDRSDAMAASVVWLLRLPRLILCLAVGAALGISGAVLQALFRNPLADPGLIGISSGAGLAAAGAIVGGDALARLWPWAGPILTDRRFLPLAAFLGGLTAIAVTRRLASRDGRTDIARLLLAGVAINALAGAVTGLFYYASDDRQMRDLTFWSLGSLAAGDWRAVAAAGPVILLALALLLRLARPLDALLLGEREARHLGIEVDRLKRRAIWAVALAVGAAVAVSGGIGFVGLVVPHMVRLIGGVGHRLVLPGAALLGACLLILADTVARLVVLPAELPVGIVTGVIGGPVFVWLLHRLRRGNA